MRRYLMIVLTCVACAPAATPASSQEPPAATMADSVRAGQRALVPPGHGTLKQDEITLAIRSGGVLVKVTPLDEATIRMLAPDTYQRLNALRVAREQEAANAVARDAELFMVSFFSYQPDMTFMPEDVQLMHQGRLLRPAAIQPLTSGWGQQRLGQQETQSAVYVFEGPIEYNQSITLRYGLEENGDWQNIVQKLESERAKILARTR